MKYKSTDQSSIMLEVEEMAFRITLQLLGYYIIRTRLARKQRLVLDYHPIVF